MVNVLDLPSDYLTYLLTEWFNMKEVGLLDCALTNKICRAAMQQLLSRQERVFDELSSEKSIKWSILRGVKVKTTFVTSNISPEELNSLLKLNKKSLCYLNVGDEFTHSEIRAEISWGPLKLCESIHTIHFRGTKEDIIEQIFNCYNHCHVLTSLSFDFIRHLSLETITMIGDACPNITRLFLAGCEFYADEDYVRRFNFPTLKQLNVSCLDYTGWLFDVILSTNHLEEYSIVNCEGKQFIIDALIQRSSQLKSLYIDSTINEMEFDNIDEFVNIINNSPKLTQFYICCIEVDYESILSCLTQFASQLTRVHLDDPNNALSTAQVIAFLKQTPLLQEVGFSVSSSLEDDNDEGDEVLQTIIDYCRQITVIWLRYLPCSKESVMKLLLALPQLRELDICSCTCMNDELFLQINDNCKQIEKLAVFGENLTEMSKNCVRNEFQSLKYFNISYFYINEAKFEEKVDLWSTDIKRNRSRLVIEKFCLD